MSDMFVLTHSIGETALRASVVYVVLLVIVRILPKRNIGSLAPNDILILVVIGGLATDGIMGGAHTLADFLLFAGFIVIWAFAVDWLDYRFPGLSWLFREKKTLLVSHGRILRKHLNDEMITEEELLAALRREGVEDLSLIKAAYLEADGHISVIHHDPSA